MTATPSSKRAPVTTRRLPQDTPRNDLTEKDWLDAEGALARHKRSAAKSPAFARAKADIAEHQATLKQLRQAMELSQQTVADALGMSQSELSRMERRTDLLWSTLTRFVEATGGRLRVVATYPDRDPVELLPNHVMSSTTGGLSAPKSPAPTRPRSQTAEAAKPKLRKQPTGRAAAKATNGSTPGVALEAEPPCRLGART